MTAPLTPAQMSERVQKNMGKLPADLQVSLPMNNSLLEVAIKYEQERYQAQEDIAERVTHTERRVRGLQAMHGDSQDSTFSANGVSAISSFIEAAGQTKMDADRVLDDMRSLMAELDTETQSVEEKVAAVAIIAACQLQEKNAWLQEQLARQATLIEAFTTEMSEHTRSLMNEVNALSQQVASLPRASPQVARQYLPVTTKDDHRSSSRTVSATTTGNNAHGTNGATKEEQTVEQQTNGILDTKDHAASHVNGHSAQIEKPVVGETTPPARSLKRKEIALDAAPGAVTTNTIAATVTHGTVPLAADSYNVQKFMDEVPQKAATRASISSASTSSSQKASASSKRVNFAGGPSAYTPSDAKPVLPQGQQKNTVQAAAASNHPSTTPTNGAVPSTSTSAGKLAPSTATNISTPTSSTGSAPSSSTPVAKQPSLKADAMAFHPTSSARPAVSQTQAAHTTPPSNYVATPTQSAAPLYTPTTMAAVMEETMQAATPAPISHGPAAPPVSSPIRDVTAAATNVALPAGMPASFMNRLPAAQRARFARQYAEQKSRQ